MKKLMLLAAMLAMVLAVAVPALAAHGGYHQGGDQESLNIAAAVNECDQYFEQNQAALQVNYIDQEADQYAAALQYVVAANIGTYGDALAAAEGNQNQTQVGNVAVPIQAVNQEGAAEQNCAALANAITLQYQNNE